MKQHSSTDDKTDWKLKAVGDGRQWGIKILYFCALCFWTG
jgi:hypothetical protein